MEIKVKRHIEIKISESEQLEIVRVYAQLHPEAAKIAIGNPKGHCPFPDQCRDFPCLYLDCNADECNNGFAFRRS